MNTPLETPGPEAPTAVEPAPMPLAPPRPGGALAALVAGLIAALALGLTLLTWALSLMFMLGLFFFMLFGLLVGAVMFRFGARSRPMPRGRVVLVTTLVALTAWATALMKEAHDFPRDFVAGIIHEKKTGRLPLYIPPQSGGLEQVRGEVQTFIDSYLVKQYPPGGMLGYVRYVSTGAPIELDIPSQLKKFTIKARVAPWVWWTRGLLALPLIWLTMYSVTAGLARTATAAELRRKY